MPVSAEFNVAVERIKASGGQVGENVSFSGIEVRVNDGSNMFSEGDTFTIPTGDELKKSKFIRKFQGNNAPGILVDVNGRMKEFYITAFTRAVVPYNDDSTRVIAADGLPAPAKVATGTAVELWKKSPNAEVALQSIAGKTLKISKIESVQTMRLRNGGIRTLGNQWVYTIDLVP